MTLAQTDFRAFREPKGEQIELQARPRLESWDARLHPTQVALQDSLDEAERLLAEPLRRLGDATDLAMALTVGLDEAIDLTSGGHDLDNYLCPLVRRLGASRFRTAWARKTHARRSYITFGQAATANSPSPTVWDFAAVECLTSAESRTWKEALAEQVPQCQVETDAVELQIAFRVGAARNWLTLWKPAVDALGGILGVEDPHHSFRPRDDRIVLLGLHCEKDVTLGNRVQLGIWWRGVP